MRYMGSKNRLAKHILPIMLAERKPGQFWVEPFVGGGNMIDKVDGPRIGCDLNQYAIDALVSIRDHLGELPRNSREFTESDYKNMRHGNYKHKGYAGFAFSWGGKWLGGWSRDSENNDYVLRAYRNAVKQSPKMQGVTLRCCSYREILLPRNSLIYCDPPYAGTTKYKDDFDSVRFWAWCRRTADVGHTVFVSEYSAPSGFVCVWEKSINNNLNNKSAAEKLFMVARRQR